MSYEEYLFSVLHPLLNNPEALKITKSADEMGILLSVDLHRSDMGTVIGKAGETAKCIRLLLKVFGSRNQARISMKINEPKDGLYAKREVDGLQEFKN